MHKDPSNKDLINLIDSAIQDADRYRDSEQQRQQQRNAANPFYGQGGIVIGKKSLSPNPSHRSLHQSPSQRSLPRNVTVSVGSKPVQESSPRNRNQMKMGQPFLSLGDFSRYGNHTLELSQEVKTRVNLKQLGSAGGGFIGKKLKVISKV